MYHYPLNFFETLNKSHTTVFCQFQLLHSLWLIYAEMTHFLITSSKTVLLDILSYPVTFHTNFADCTKMNAQFFPTHPSVLARSLHTFPLQTQSSIVKHIPTAKWWITWWICFVFKTKLLHSHSRFSFIKFIIQHTFSGMDTILKCQCLASRMQSRLQPRHQQLKLV